MAQINPRTFTDARELGDNVYELILTNWGNRGANQDQNNGSVIYPPVKSLANGAITLDGQFTGPPITSLAGIAISPRSQVDQCILTYTPLPQTASFLPNVPPSPTSGIIPPPLPQVPPVGGDIAIPLGFINRGGVLESEQLLSVGAPLIGQQLGPILVRAVSQHWFGDTFVPDPGSPTPATGTDYGTALSPQIWVNPELRLLLYFTAPVLPPLKRAPSVFSFSTALLGAPDVIVKTIPVMGRRVAIVSIKNVSANPAVTVTITGTINELAASGVTPTLTNYEIPLVTPVTLGAHEAAEFCVPCCGALGVSYMIVYLSSLAAVGDFVFRVSLFD